MSKIAKVQINDILDELNEQNFKLKTHLINANKLIQILVKFKNYLFQNKCRNCLCHSSEQLIELENQFNQYRIESNETFINSISTNKQINDDSTLSGNQALDNIHVIQGINEDMCLSDAPNNGHKFLNINGNYQCDTCGHQFRNFSGLKRHLLTHTGVKPFACDWPQCHRSFSQKYAMRGHYMRVHMAAKLKDDVKFGNDDEVVEIDVDNLKKNSRNKYECHWVGCGQEFKWLSGIKRHLGVHQKTIRCVWNGCDKTFAQIGNMKDHYLRIHCVSASVNSNSNLSTDNNNENHNNNNDSNDNENSFENTDQQINDKVIEKNNGAYVCDWSGCGLEFPYYSRLERHLNVHKGLKPFKCPECERTFGQKSNMRQHLLLVHKINLRIENKRNSYKTSKNEIPSDQRYTNKRFTTSNSNVLKSITRKYSINKLKDKIGDNAIETYFARKSCVNFSHDGQFYICKWPECDIKFVNYAGIRRHLLSHSQVKPYRCLSSGCDRTFSQKYNMISHFNTCHNEAQQIESLCQSDGSITQQFEASNAIVRDIENELTDKNISHFERLENLQPKSNASSGKSRKNRRTRALFNCPHSYCNQLFQSKRSLEIHEKSTHDINNKFVCTHNGCEARLSTKQLYENHMKRHRIEFKCHYEHCGYKTHLEFSYRYHMSRHSGEELFKCELCHESFTFLGYLNSHMKKVHSIANPIKCEWPGCESSFGTVAGLRKHKSLHTGEKKYLCEWPACGKRFRFCSSLTNHLRVHNGLKPFKCQQCGKNFQQKVYLKIHIKRIHHK